MVKKKKSDQEVLEKALPEELKKEELSEKEKEVCDPLSDHPKFHKFKKPSGGEK